MRSMFASKKGLSPLIATILLIAFAVALGAVVMNLGPTIGPSMPFGGDSECGHPLLENQLSRGHNLSCSHDNRDNGRLSCLAGGAAGATRGLVPGAAQTAYSPTCNLWLIAGGAYRLDAYP